MKSPAQAATAIARRKPTYKITSVTPGGYQPAAYAAKVAQAMGPRTSSAPAAPGTGPAATPGAAPATPPRATPNPTADPEYTQGIADLMRKIASDRAALGLDAARDSQDLATTMERMGLARERDLQDTNKNANREGLFYSGILDKRRADVTRDYANREGDARLAGQRRGEDRRAAQDALGEIVKDDTSPLGYRATGAAGEHLLELYRRVLARQLAADGALAA